MEALQGSRCKVVAQRKGSTAYLECRGYNIAKFGTVLVWKFKGKKIRETDTINRVVEIPLGGRRKNFYLLIPNVSEKDVGKYTCIARVDDFVKPDVAHDCAVLKLKEEGEFYLDLFFFYAKFSTLKFTVATYHKQPSRFSCICCRSYWFQG